jgi:hypothetical protein
MLSDEEGDTAALVVINKRRRQSNCEVPEDSESAAALQDVAVPSASASPGEGRKIAGKGKRIVPGSARVHMLGTAYARRYLIDHPDDVTASYPQIGVDELLVGFHDCPRDDSNRVQSCSCTALAGRTCDLVSILRSRQHGA